jgi:hypothetical protein
VDNTDLTQDIVGTPTEIAAARLEQVMQVVSSDFALNDSQKETVAFDVLSRDPKEVVLEVLNLLPVSIKRLKASPASAARLFNVFGRLVNEDLTLNPRATAEFRIQYVLRNSGTTVLWTQPSLIANQLEYNLPELTQVLLELLPVKIETLKQQRLEEQQTALPVKLTMLENQATGLQLALEELLERKHDLETIGSELLKTDTPKAQAQLLLTRFRSRARDWNRNTSPNLKSFQDLLNSAQNAAKLLQPEAMQALLPLILEDFNPPGAYAETPEYQEGQMLSVLFDARLLSKVEFSEVERPLLLAHLELQSYFHPFHEVGLRLIGFLASVPQPSGAIVALLRRILITNGYAKENLKPFKALLESGDYPVSPGEAWADAALHELEISEHAKVWQKILTHANTSKTKSDAKWEKTALEIMAGIPDFEGKVLSWLALVGKPRTIKLATANNHFDPFNSNILRGLIWALVLQPASDVLARAFAAVTETSLKKIPGLGPRGTKIANASVFALGCLDSLFAVGQLARLKTRVTFKTALKEIEKALESAATRQGISKADLEELSVPSCGLDRVGALDLEFGEAARAELRVVNSDVVLTWFDAKNKVLKNPPASVKKEFADDLKELKTTIKDLEQMLSAQNIRLERFMLARQTWNFADWHERYLEHPVVGCVARRLIWTFSFEDKTQNAIWLEGTFKNQTGHTLEIPKTATVSLWHPLQSNQKELLEWRGFLEQHSIVQPWKQAHREVYILTNAEIRTRVYSNRFAAHIIKQHQFNQLAALRGWNNKLRLMVDDTYPPAALELPQWGLRAEYWVEGAGNNYGVDTTETGTYLYLSTDQVRFYRTNSPQNLAHAGGGGYEQWLRADQNLADPIPLEQIPALVLSEVLRDVDLFVGVASVGNDPTWNDGGPQGRYREYWQSYSFGDLSETAQSRKTLLEKLIPRLKIKEVARVDGKFLHIKGSIREYKIHLGSSNILMLPNDQYLCIVPGANTANASSDVRLPFEGDRTLAVILSKAFLLADDKKISDPTITRQINSR